MSNAGGNGKIGDREVFKVGNQVFEVVEAQVNPTSSSDYGSWRLFLVNKTANTAQKLSPAFAGGAQSLGNPTVSFLTLPTGVPAPESAAVTVAVNVTLWPALDGLTEEATLVDVPSCTTCERLELLLFCHPFVPAKVALIEWVPSASELVEKVACPVPSTEDEPSVFAPSLNVTVPVGGPAPESAAVTVAVKVKD